MVDFLRRLTFKTANLPYVFRIVFGCFPIVFGSFRTVFATFWMALTSFFPFFWRRRRRLLCRRGDPPPRLAVFMDRLTTHFWCEMASRLAHHCVGSGILKTAEKSRGWLEIGWFSEQIDRRELKFEKFSNKRASEQASKQTKQTKKSKKKFEIFFNFFSKNLVFFLHSIFFGFSPSGKFGSLSPSNPLKKAKWR